ncbi:hypothetical protein BMF94_6604 [Rhodotorula taiwanensis]|uniref:Signal recognition particle subunit SRP72 n=1 Tax=Rhodotorula taiwanensis TaxID=741276 RepID=A0A2S5B0L3_9BASI|nr:hypothetical protein BMF94_6604 [Rhodotorula taiwanensis]
MAPSNAVSPQQAQQKLYRTLHDQLDLALYPQALRTVNKLLARDPQDQLARQTHSQLVVALDRYPDALRLDSTDDATRAYCLYKLARPQEARTVLEQAAGDDRANQVLEAQLSYRLGDYERARDLFDELAATAEADSPELADLEANLTACTAQLDFVAEIPTTLANLSSSGSRAIPPIDELEARPLALVLPAASTSNLGGGAAAAAAAAATDRGKRTRTARRRPRGARFAASATTTSEEGAPFLRIPAELAQQPAPAEDRWIPKRQRPSMRDALLQAKEKQRGRKRDKVLAAMAATQGAAAVPPPSDEPKAKATGAGAKPGGGGNKKKKGGRK